MSKWSQIRKSVLFSILMVAGAYVLAEHTPHRAANEPGRPFESGQSDMLVQEQITQYVDIKSDVCMTADGGCVAKVAEVGELCYCDFEGDPRVPGILQ